MGLTVSKNVRYNQRPKHDGLVGLSTLLENASDKIFKLFKQV